MNYFNNLNSLEFKQKDAKTKKDIKPKSGVSNILKIKELKKVLSQQCNFSLTDYSVIFCQDRYDMYETIICAIVDSYSNIVGMPHIICGTMEHPDVLSLLNKLHKTKHIELMYVNTDIYGGIQANQIEPLIQKIRPLL